MQEVHQQNSSDVLVIFKCIFRIRFSLYNPPASLNRQSVFPSAFHCADFRTKGSYVNMFKVCILAMAAGAMALPKIEHRAENSASDNDLSKYYEKFQQYMQNDRLNNYFKPASPASSAGSEVQSDSQQQYGIPNNFNQYQEQFGQLQNNQYFKDCMAQNGASFNQIPNFGFPGSGSDAASNSGSNSNYFGSSNNYSPDKFQEAFKKCQSSMQSNIPNSSQYQIPNFNNPFTGTSSGSSATTSG